MSQKNVCIGLLAHVDAGKTTCIESMLFNSGRIRKMGRVDHQDAFLDFDAQERERGITIYSKEASFQWNDTDIYVIDTPGHIDFSAEMERTLSVIDLAVIVINGQDGVQSHTETIWRCLEHYNVPCVIFVNKMDISVQSQTELMADLQKHLSDMCFDIHDYDAEKIALANEEMMEYYLEHEEIQSSHLQEAILNRQIFPCLFGCALKNIGIDTLLNQITSIAQVKQYPDTLGARVYKISQDEHGGKLTHVKVTGGSLFPKQKLNETEKIDQLRLYNGSSFVLLNEAKAGTICVIKGLDGYQVGSGIGFEVDNTEPVLEPCMNYELILPKGIDALSLSEVCKQLEQEDPQLHLEVNSETHKITLQIMGEVQMEILQRTIKEKTGIDVGFGTGKIMYRETIRNTVDGAGHFEPLRHYAEVHVRLEPLPTGSGVIVESETSTDDLAMSWQKQIMTILSRMHRGVLTGSPLTDVKIILTGGKAHLKHTEGGDFRQAARRAVRQGLMKAESVILEPYYQFELYVPTGSLSKALYDLELKKAKVSVEEMAESDTMKITGKGPIRLLMNYQQEVLSYTRGKGRFIASLIGYLPSDDQSSIIQERRYDPDMDQFNPSSSVFCAHGSGYQVPWNQADALMHVQINQEVQPSHYGNQRNVSSVSQDELNRIFEMTYGRNQNETKKVMRKKEYEDMRKVKATPQLPPCLIVDGYNMIFAWDDLKDIARDDLYVAREKLIEKIAAYQAYTQEKVIIVFDGYKVVDNIGTVSQRGKMTIVYTKENQTADAWIEKAAYDMHKQYAITVASSDALIQNAIFSQGALRMPARELLSRIEYYEGLTRKE